MHCCHKLKPQRNHKVSNAITNEKPKIKNKRMPPKKLSDAKQAIADSIISQGCRPCNNLVRGCNQPLPITYTKSKCEICLATEREMDKARRDKAKVEHEKADKTAEQICCAACKHEKPKSEFMGDRGVQVVRCQACRELDKRNNLKRDKEKRREQGRQYDLKRADKKKAYNIANPEIMQKAWRSYRARQVIADVEEALRKGAEQQAATRKAHPEYAQAIRYARKTDPHHAFGVYKSSAKEKSIDMTMEEDAMRSLFFGNCFYCNEPKGEFLQGINRMDQFEGYIPGNCVTCCQSCNMMKGCLDAATFIRRAKHITAIQNGVNEELHPASFPNPLSATFSRYRNRAIEKNLPFEITTEHFDSLISMPCYLCAKESLDDHCNGIDRVDNTLGYIESNIQSCCGECNLMKKTFDFNFFCDKLKAVHEHWQARELPNVREQLWVIMKTIRKKKAGDRAVEKSNRKRQKVERAKAYLQSIGRGVDDEDDDNSSSSSSNDEDDGMVDEIDEALQMTKELNDPSNLFHQFCIQEGHLVEVVDEAV